LTRCLAYAFGSDFYWELQNLTESQQREMIANSLYLHRKKGTVWAIKRVLEILGFDIAIVEWWQSDSTMEGLGIKPQEPYTFAVVLDVAKFYNSSKSLLSESEQRRILKYLYIYKNVRSHFDFYLKTNMQNSISASITTELTECKTERLEGKDFVQDSNPNSISYISIADIQDTEIRELESVDSKKVANLNIGNFGSAELTECRVEELEGIDFVQDSNPNSISYISIADIRDTEIREFESNPIENL